MGSSSRLATAGSTCGPYLATPASTCRSVTPERESRPKTWRQSSRSSGRSGRPTRKLKAPGLAWPCRGGSARRTDLGPEPGGKRLDVHLHDSDEAGLLKRGGTVDVVGIVPRHAPATVPTW